MMVDVILPALQLCTLTSAPASAAPPPSFSPGVKYHATAISATPEEESKAKSKKIKKGGDEEQMEE
jgi:hypothetical protein